MSEAKGWFDSWKAKGDDDIKMEAARDLGFGFETGQIQAKAKAVTDAVAKGDYKTAGDGSAWIEFIGLPHVYPGASDFEDSKNISLLEHLLK